MKKSSAYVLILAIFVLLPGCAMHFNVPTVDVTVAPPVVSQKIPLKVGIFVDENYVLTKTMPDFAGETTLTVPFGKLIKQSALSVLPYVFESVDIVKGEPSPPGIEGLFIAEVEDFNKEPEGGGKPSIVNLSLAAKVVDLTGMPIWGKTINMQETEFPKAMFSKEAQEQFYGNLIAKATANAFKKIVKEISSSREVYTYASTKSKSILTGTPPSKEISTFIKSDVDEISLINAKLNKTSYAIVIGIEQYRQKLPKADFAVSDAQTVAQYLTKVMSYPEENVITLTNDHAALGDLTKYFEKWLPNNVEKGSTVFVYYSGHGAPNPKSGDAYLVPYDGDPSFIDETGYSLKRMYAALGKLPAKEIIVALDSCFSGAGGRSVIAKGSRPLVMNFQSNVVLPKNVTVLSASSGDQTSSTYDEKGHGLFTYFLLKGIKNEDVVKADGSLKIDDLYGYLKPQVERIARKQYNNEQTPQLSGARAY